MRAFVLFIVIGPPIVAVATDCENLRSLRLKDASITSASAVAAGAFSPPEGPQNGPYKALSAFCRVHGVSTPAPDSQIEFEVWMPESGWNGKYFGIGNGGFAGSIQYSLMAAALQNGYASSSTDTGHKGPATEGDWGSRPLRKDRGLCLSSDSRDSREVQVSDARLLWPQPQTFLFRRMLERRKAGADGSAALPGRLGRDHRRRSGEFLDSQLRGIRVGRAGARCGPDSRRQNARD